MTDGQKLTETLLGGRLGGGREVEEAGGRGHGQGTISHKVWSQPWSRGCWKVGIHTQAGDGGRGLLQQEAKSPEPQNP